MGNSVIPDIATTENALESQYNEAEGRFINPLGGDLLPQDYDRDGDTEMSLGQTPVQVFEGAGQV